MSESTVSTFAVVDIGSNTVKLSVYTCEEDGPGGIVHDADTVRVGYRVSKTGVIAPERIELLTECLLRYEQIAREHDARAFHAVATQAFRIATNTADVIAHIEAETSWRVRVIDAGEETELTIEGARPWLVPGKRNVVADIGGASTEIIAVDGDGSVIRAGSIPFGSGLIYDEEIGDSPPPPGSLDRARDRVSRTLTETDAAPDQASVLLLPGGTGHYLSLLLASLEPSTPFGPDGLPTLHEWLANRNANETMQRIPVQLERAQVLPASLAIVEALVLRLSPTDIIAVPSGIRDGIARLACPPR